MANSTLLDELPLRWWTPDRWAAGVMRDPIALLNDHAHLEKKAANNALELLNRWPEPDRTKNWVGIMTGVARDEIEHLGTVTRIMAQRGARLSRTHVNQYAAELRSLVRRGRGLEDLVDRLLISALIEARSCERFAVLADHCNDTQLARLYRGLFASEAGHYRVFIGLARQVLPRRVVDERWSTMLDNEAVIIQRQPVAPAMHSGVA